MGRGIAVTPQTGIEDLLARRAPASVRWPEGRHRATRNRTSSRTVIAPWSNNHLIGIDPDGRVHVSERLLMLHDGPLLEQSLKACAAALIRPPRGKQYHPDRDRLLIRFEQFQRAA